MSDSARSFSGGDSGGGGSAGLVGSDAWGEGGGRTKELGSRELVASPSGFNGAKAGAGSGGINSVSYDTTLEGEASDRLETRCAFRPLPALPTLMFLAGDLRGDLCTALRGDFLGEDSLNACVFCLWGDAGTGVGGRSASIFSTSHDRFSSRNLIRSA